MYIYLRKKLKLTEIERERESDGEIGTARVKMTSYQSLQVKLILPFFIFHLKVNEDVRKADKVKL